MLTKGDLMHIIVVGGNGFIGSHFVACVVDAGHTVTVVGRNKIPRLAHHRSFEFFGGGLDALVGNYKLLESADIICHFASSSIPATSNLDPVGDIECNLISTVKLLEAMRVVGRKRILYLSSGGAVYGRPKFSPITEDHPLNPVSAYGINKVAAEKYLSMYAELYGFEPLVIRPANPYGPGQGKVGQLGAVTTFLSLAMSGKTATVWGDGSVIRDFVYISDLCDLLLKGLESSVSGIYNCGSGKGTSLSDLMQLIEQVSGKVISRDFQPARPFDPPEILLDISKAQADFGWHPKVSLLQGLNKI